MDQLVARSEASIRSGSTSFAAASQLFGRELREDVWQLYAWCRHCDDEIDGQEGGGVSRALTVEERALRLAQLRQSTRAALAGGAVCEPAFAAFGRVAARHAIPEQWPLELLEGLAQDVDAAPMPDQEATLRYCWGVAGTVGVMMALVMGARDLAVLRRAQDLGLAFQLTNICRDVMEDARNGRLYLPADLLRAEGVEPSPQAVLAPANHAAVFRVVKRQIALAEAYYLSARHGLRDLPFRGAMAVAAARDIYREIGRRIARQGPAALEYRMYVPKAWMTMLLLRAVVVALWSRLGRLAPRPERPTLWSRL